MIGEYWIAFPCRCFVVQFCHLYIYCVYFIGTENGQPSVSPDYVYWQFFNVYSSEYYVIV